MINFATLKGFATSKGNVTQIAKDGVVLWVLSSGKIVLEVVKITSKTYAGETTYTDEQFILLDIYPKANGTVKVTYGGLTKTITDTSGAAEPNAQQVVFGTFNGVTHDTTPANGELTIEGDCYAFGIGTFKQTKLISGVPCNCITELNSLGNIEVIPKSAFGTILAGCNKIEKIKISARVKDIGAGAFARCVRLANITVDSNNKYYSSENGILFNKDKTHLHSCPAVTGHFIIPSSVKTIEDVAYAGGTDGTLDGVTIHSNVTSIGSNSFYHSKAGFVVKVLGATPCTIGESAFSYISEGAYPQIIVPKGCGEIYKAAEGWKVYADYIVEES